MAPKHLQSKSEQVSLLVSKPLIFIVLHSHLFDIKWFSSNHYEAARVETAEGHDEVHSEEELRLLVSESYKMVKLINLNINM